jgi:hypothetical protein
MQALTTDDLLPLEEFASRRAALFEAQLRYLDRYRRVRVGPRACLLFENRQTLWFRVQEVMRVARLTAPDRVRQELELYNRLLPGPNRLHAALLIDADETRLREELAPWQSLTSGGVRFVLGGQPLETVLVTCRPEDCCNGTAHWLHFTLSATGRTLLADFGVPAHVEIRLAEYAHASPCLGDDVRQSLLDDLALSDRDRA